MAFLWRTEETDKTIRAFHSVSRPNFEHADGTVLVRCSWNTLRAQIVLFKDRLNWNAVGAACKHKLRHDDDDDYDDNLVIVVVAVRLQIFPMFCRWSYSLLSGLPTFLLYHENKKLPSYPPSFPLLSTSLSDILSATVTVPLCVQSQHYSVARTKKTSRCENDKF